VWHESKQRMRMKTEGFYKDFGLGCCGGADDFAYLSCDFF
jgi:hypothetical protein